MAGDPVRKARWQKDNKDKHNRSCKEWAKRNPEKITAITSNWQKRNPERAKEIRRKTILKTRYGITPDQHDRMILEQNNLCYLCRNPAGGKYSTLHIDHNADTGVVRKLLCHHCNTALGGFKHSPELLRTAADYLEEHGLS